MIGFPSIVHLKQAAAAWHDVVVGDGDAAKHHTLGWIGCLATVAAILANTVAGANLTPADINAIAKRFDCYGANAAGYKILLNLEKLGPHIGLKMLDRERIRLPLNWRPEDHGLAVTPDEIEKMRVARLRLLAGEVLAAGGAVVLHVDHNSDKPDGDPFGDHFICGVQRGLADLNILDTITCSDPAPGSTVKIDEKSMSGESDWGEKTKRHYRVVSVAPVWKA